jgi:hypothetical protein
LATFGLRRAQYLARYSKERKRRKNEIKTPATTALRFLPLCRQVKTTAADGYFVPEILLFSWRYFISTDSAILSYVGNSPEYSDESATGN